MGLRDYLFYEEPGITLYCGDCREVFPLVKADVIVTDPPYGISYQSGWKDESNIRNDGGYALRDNLLMEWGARPAIVFGCRSIPRPVTYREVLIWDKGDWPGMGDLSFPWGSSHEEIYVIGEPFVGQREGTVYRAIRITNGWHPTQKPTSLLRRLINHTIGIVLDPFCGSGSTLQAAKEVNRSAIGIEIEPKYCEIAVKRLRQEVLAFP